LLKNLRLSFAFCVIVTAGAVAVSAQAFTPGSEVGGSKAGSGAASVGGYSVSNVKFAYVSAGSRISAVTFKLDQAAGSARVAFGGAVWNGCTVATTADLNGKYAASCQGLDVPVAAAHDLSVVAQQA
jgi:hypothetical protein